MNPLSGVDSARAETGQPGRTAVIAGSGGERALPGYRQETVDTPYGQALVFRATEEDPIFLSRHGPEHDLPPHRINYRANISALRLLGVDRVLATFTVGSLVEEVAPGDVVLPDQVLDFSSGRAATFFEGGEAGVEHAEFTEPFCSSLRAALVRAAGAGGLAVRPAATYVCTNGPRLETAAEVRMYAMLGGDVVGMTAMPEVVLAREAGLHYAGIAVSVNWAAGLRGSVVLDRVAIDSVRSTLVPLMLAALREVPAGECSCARSVDQRG